MAVNTRLPTHALWAAKFWHRANAVMELPGKDIRCPVERGRRKGVRLKSHNRLSTGDRYSNRDMIADSVIGVILDPFIG